MINDNVRREETAIIPVITDYPVCYLDNGNKKTFVFKNGFKTGYQAKPRNAIPLTRTSMRIWGNSYISGAKGFSEYENEQLIKTGVWVQNTILYYVADADEADEFYKRRKEKTMSPLMEEAFGKYDNKKIIRRFVYTSFVADIKNSRLYIRHSNMKDLYWKAIGSTKKYGSFETIVPYFSIQQLKNTLDLYSLHGTKSYLHPDIEKEIKKTYPLNRDLSFDAIDDYVTKAAIDYIYDTIKKIKDFREWEQNERIRDFITPITGYVASPYKDEARKQSKAIACLAPFDTMKLNKDERDYIEDKLIDSIYKFAAIKFYLTAPGLGKAYKRENKDIALYYSSIRGKVKDKVARKFKCTGNNYKDVKQAFSDYPKTNGAKQRAYNDPYCAVDAWAICKRLGKTKDINDFNAVYSYLRKDGLYKFCRYSRLRLGLTYSGDVYHEYKDILKNKSLAKILSHSSLENYLSSLQRWHDLKKKLGKKNCVTINGIPFERLSFYRLDKETRKLMEEINAE